MRNKDNKYISATADIVLFDSDDIITTSPVIDETLGGDEDDLLNPDSGIN